MNRVSRVRVWSIGTLVALASCASVSSAAGAEQQRGADLRVVEQTPVEVDGLRILGLSPDGTWLFGYGDDQVCAVDAATATTSGCAPFPGSVDEENLAWAPDGSRLAFTENSAVYVHDSDVWLFAPATATLTNLTDDGYDGSLIGFSDNPPDPVLVDTNPAWSPDGRTIAFARSEFYGPDSEDVPYTTRLYLVPATGGEPEYVAQVSSEPLAVWLGLRWLPDGERLAFVVANRAPSSPFNGLWVVEVATGATEPILGADAARGAPQLLAVSPAGEALIFYGMLAGQGSDVGPLFALVDLETGRAHPVAAPRDDPRSPVSRVALSPDGAQALLTVATGDRLILRDLATGEEQDLLADLPAGERPGAIGFRLDWAENDLVYVSTSPSGGILLQLGSA